MPNHPSELNLEPITLVDIVEKTPTKESWTRWGWEKVVKPTFLFGVATLTSIPNAVNALVAATNTNPKEIVHLEWWKSLPLGKLLLSIANASASLLINIIMNLLFFPLAVQSFYKNIRDFNNNPIKNILAIILGLGGALGAATIAYDAFLWFPDTSIGVGIAASAALFNFSIYVATRYVGASKALKKITNLFDIDAKTQAEFVDKLDHINKTYKNEINKLFDDLKEINLQAYTDDESLHPEDLENLIKQLGAELADFGQRNPDLFNNKTKCETFINGALTLIDLSFAIAIIGTPALLTFMQAGFKGINKISEVIAQQPLDNLNPWTKRSIGLIPGIASGLLYGVSAFDLRTTIIEVAKNIYKNPTPLQIFSAVILCVANVLSRTSMQNVATNVVSDKNNLVFISPESAYRDLFTNFNALAGVVINGNSTLQKAYIPRDITPEKLSIETLSAYLGKRGDHPITKNTSQYLRSLSLFHKEAQVKDEEQNRNERESNLSYSSI